MRIDREMEDTNRQELNKVNAPSLDPRLPDPDPGLSRSRSPNLLPRAPKLPSAIAGSPRRRTSCRRCGDLNAAVVARIIPRSSPHDLHPRSSPHDLHLLDLHPLDLHPLISIPGHKRAASDLLLSATATTAGR